NQDGHLSEGSAENLFMLRDGKLVTPPVSDNILEGITRSTVIELAREELGLEVMERPIDRTEVYISDEFFMTGTAAQVTAITQVDYRTIGNGEMGPVATQLREIYDQVVRGKLKKYRQWNTAIYEKMVVKS
ncbi:MAG: aminotransferase class IV, partial [Proteobacteria bacterium]|nr:aminotransferase class IV [Pseudomonadota bacterium]